MAENRSGAAHPAIAAILQKARQGPAIGAQDLIAVDAGAPNFVARLMTPKGPVTLESKGL